MIEQAVNVAPERIRIDRWHVLPALHELCAGQRLLDGAEFGHWLTGPRDDDALAAGSAINDLTPVITKVPDAHLTGHDDQCITRDTPGR